jgi:hypothetical protein
MHNLVINDFLIIIYTATVIIIAVIIPVIIIALVYLAGLAGT